MKYADLTQKRPPCLPHCRGYTPAIWRELDDLYAGGYQIHEKAAEYLPRAAGESEERYRERLRATAYVNFIGPIVDYYAGALFSDPVTVGPVGAGGQEGEPPTFDPAIYEGFARNADLRGTTFALLLKDLFTTALIHGKALLGADFPPRPDDLAVPTLAHEERLGLGRPYVFPIAPDELLDWEYDEVVRLDPDHEVELEVGRFLWAIRRKCYTPRTSPEQRRPKRPIEEFRVWRRLADSRVAWELYRTGGGDEAPGPEDEVPLVAQGVTSFRDIPLLELRLPANLWLGNLLAHLCLEHWRRRSALIGGQQRSLFELPVVRLGPEIGAVDGPLPAERAQNPARGDDPRRQFEQKGYIVLGHQDSLQFVGPSGAVYGIIDKQLDKLENTIFQIANRMAASLASSAALARSGVSKALDLEATMVTLRAYGVLVRDVAARAYELVSDARGERVDWVAHGLDRFEAYDRATTLQEALQSANLPVASGTFKTEYQTRLAFALLPGLPPAVQEKIRGEIAAANAQASGDEAGEDVPY
jgi:hypothetical protein